MTKISYISLMAYSFLFAGLLFLYLIYYRNIDEMLILLFIFVLLGLALLNIFIINNSSQYSTTFADGRFYFILFLLIYSIWVPIMSIASNITVFGFSPLNIYQSAIYESNVMSKSLIISNTMMFGFLIGTYIINKVSTKKEVIHKHKYNENKILRYWFLIVITSTLIYMLPFINGGFVILMNGGSIVDVPQFAELYGGNIILSLVGFLFSPEVMTISTIIYIYYLFKNSNISYKKKIVVTILIIIFHITLTLFTTRSARLVIILFSIIAILFSDKKLISKNSVKTLLLFVPLSLVGIYFIDFIFIDDLVSKVTNSQSMIVELMRRFDGIGPYDAFLQSVNERPDISMILNSVYSLLVPIPILGASILSLLNINYSHSPMYSWMASKYPSIYESGGGLAFIPQTEMYLIGGIIGTFVISIFLGLIFGKSRIGVLNLILIAFGLMFARGNLGIIATLTTPYILLSYLLYNTIILRLSIERVKL